MSILSYIFIVRCLIWYIVLMYDDSNIIFYNVEECACQHTLRCSNHELYLFFFYMLFLKLVHSSQLFMQRSSKI